MTNTSNTPDPRVEAAAAAMWEQRPMMRNADGAPRPWAEVPAWSHGARYRGQAQVALAAADAVDPRKPRTITTAEELDALPNGAVVKDSDPSVCEKLGGRWFIPGVEEGYGRKYITLPAVVLYEPEAETTA